MKKLILIASSTLLTLLTLVCLGAFWGYQTVIEYSQTPLSLSEPKELTVERGTSVNQLAQQLANDGVIQDTWKLKWLLKFRPELAKIRSGLYEISPSQTITDLLNDLIAGKVKTFSLTLVEGKTIVEWEQQLTSAPHLQMSPEVFAAVLMAQGDDSGLPEGKFFPDTYHYTAEADVKVLLTQSYKMMEQELAKAWAERAPNLPLKSPYEMLILASIVEKETGQAHERDQIAGVFVNRLNQGMRLQTDPTVIYGMGERYKGNITRKDLVEETPFNTYRIFGLPPTPIAAPSKASLMAVSKPASVSYLYFVSRNDGTHVFSSTLEAHNQAVDVYQRKKKPATPEKSPK
ncbi:endolytic transglycosylase MltG [Shewanella baltica]|uniref:endolytic transglycosylase MltG n=1 Tax=Shewanella baltica TaxID=62322 RepID=UPI00217DA1FE|nr:endolytic transglycosylase MltG [Shewanella baltica]MCS6174336.1 endolytic transglycosylase MltG [Shewanella baltica]